MPTTDPRVDAYLAASAPFARPILERLRKAFHRGCPRLQETIKWGAPAFEADGILGGMSAFKAHVSMGLWRGKELEDPQELFARVGSTEMAGLRLTCLKDLPTQAVLVDYIRRAAALNAARAKDPKKLAKPRRPAPKTPADLAAALAKSPRAKTTFASFPPGAKRDYIVWITGAKQAATRAKRLATTLEWLAEGKRRNWKYESC
ncbi:MAG: YdeI/OmpD-associated family protein [Planctomycetota bacterium]|nr:YdeI/OmpD-associated family protein [Planctomycetota bacterium]